MCFHTQQHRSAEDIHRRFGTNGPVTTGTYNGFTHPQMTVITDEQPTVTALHQWGLIPKWAKDHSIQKHTLNARVETLSQKPSFRKARRCLVLADAFFEWQWLDPKGKRKQKHCITHPDDHAFAFAGLWDEWVDRQTGEIIRSFAIVTTEAQGIMREVHNSKLRMPYTLASTAENEWLNGLSPAPFTEFKAWAVV